MIRDITLSEWIELRNNKELTLIDVRSPSEFEDSTIPGSINIPLFDDRERAEIGTLYKQTSVQAAKERGLEIVAAKLPAFIKQFAEISGQKIVFCWRGGMRSRTTATLLSLMDIHAYRLTGGYRAYRKWIVEKLNDVASSFTPVPLVINGFTGSGKTSVLRELSAQGHPVLDFEMMAGHRGSIFGQIGLKANNQKTFESLLMEELTRLGKAPYVLFEAESKRIGKVVLPDPIVQMKERAVRIWLEIPLKKRIEHIVEDYRPWEFGEECLHAFLKIKSRIHTPVATEIEYLMKAGEYRKAVELLLVFYYDPKYEHSTSVSENTPDIVIHAQHVQEAVQKIKDFVRDTLSNPELR